MLTEYLSNSELLHLTGYRRAGHQSNWLKERSLPHRTDGPRVIVSRVHVQAWLEGRTVPSSGLNLAALR
uniref:DUF4224 domain-containing protein n=1 Tax=Rhodoferax sp. GW822-FHT02A01 TaxID=3141537 RepID=UPI00406C248D